jgi:hypothetical protein
MAAVYPIAGGRFGGSDGESKGAEGSQPGSSISNFRTPDVAPFFRLKFGSLPAWGADQYLSGFLAWPEVTR